MNKYTLNGEEIDINVPTEIDGILYPHLRDEETRLILGIVETEIEDLLGEIAVTHDKETIKSRIKEHRDNLFDNGEVLVEGNWFQSDRESKLRYLALKLAGVPDGLKWKVKGGTFVDMTPTLVDSIVSAQINRELSIFANAERHINIVDTLQPEELNDYVFEDGWPERYTGE